MGIIIHRILKVQEVGLLLYNMYCTVSVPFPDSSDQELVLDPGLTLLSQAERKLCGSVSMKPRDYLSMKTEMIKHTALKRSGYQSQPRLPKTLTATQRSRLMQFFTKSGWAG